MAAYANLLGISHVLAMDPFDPVLANMFEPVITRNSHIVYTGWVKTGNAEKDKFKTLQIQSNLTILNVIQKIIYQLWTVDFGAIAVVFIFYLEVCWSQKKSIGMR